MEVVCKSNEKSSKRRKFRHVTSEERHNLVIGSNLAHSRRLKKLDRQFLAPLKLPFNSFLNRDWHLILRIYPAFLKCISDNRTKCDKKKFCAIKDCLSIKTIFETVKCFSGNEVIYYVKFENFGELDINISRDSGDHAENLHQIFKSSNLCIFLLESFLIVNGVVWMISTVLFPIRIVSQPKPMEETVTANEKIKPIEANNTKNENLKNDSLLEYMNQIKQRCSLNSINADSDHNKDYPINHFGCNKAFKQRTNYSIATEGIIIESPLLNNHILKIETNNNGPICYKTSSSTFLNLFKHNINLFQDYQNNNGHNNLALLAKKLLFCLEKSNFTTRTQIANNKNKEQKESLSINNNEKPNIKILKTSEETFKNQENKTKLSSISENHGEKTFVNKTLSDTNKIVIDNGEICKKLENRKFDVLHTTTSLNNENNYGYQNQLNRSTINTLNRITNELSSSLGATKSLHNLQKNVLNIENRLINFHENISEVKQEINRLLLQHNIIQTNNTNVIEKLKHEVIDCQLNSVELRYLQERLNSLERALEQSEEKRLRTSKTDVCHNDYNKRILISYALSASFLIGFIFGDIVKW